MVASPLTDPAAAPKQGFEGAPDAWLVLEPGVAAGLDGMRPGDEIIVLTWLHRARRDVLRVHPRDDRPNPERGVFTTRSADRPNPIGLHRVEVAAIEGAARARPRPRGGRRDARRRPEARAPPAVIRRVDCVPSVDRPRTTRPP